MTQASLNSGASERSSAAGPDTGWGARVGAKLPRLSRAAWVVLASGILAAVIRLTAVSGVLPYVHHADEPTVERVVFKVARNPTESPGFFNYPSVLFYSQALVLRTYELVTGTRAAPLEKLSRGVTRTDYPGWWLSGRGLTLTLGSILSALSAALAIRLSGNLLAGVIAGIWTALSPTLTYDSTLMTPDTYAAFFSFAALWFSSTIQTRDDWRPYAAAGVAVGLAAGSKYTVAIVAISVVIAALSRHGLRAFLRSGVWIAGGVSVVAFVCSTPFAIFDHSKFWEDLTFEWRHYAEGHAGIRGSSAAYYANTLVDFEGAKLLFAPLGFLVRPRSARNSVLAVAAFALCYFVFIARTPVHFLRNLVPVVAPFLVLSSVGLCAALERLVKSLRWRVASAAVVSVLVAAKPAYATYEGIVDQHENPRAGPEKWIDEHLPPGSVVVVESYGPWIDPKKFKVVGIDGFAQFNDKQLARSKARYVVIAQQYYLRYYGNPEKYRREVARYDRLIARHCVLLHSKVERREIQVVDLECTP